MADGLIRRMLGRARRPVPLSALYEAIVAEAREPDWYRAGAVPDTLDGRFDMVAAVLALVLLRLEAAGPEGAVPAARLTEIFVADMDGQLRQAGVGDLVVGKHVGRMMGQLGGRLTAYRAGLAEGGDLAGAVERNIHRGEPVPAAARGHVAARLRALAERLRRRDLEALLKGSL